MEPSTRNASISEPSWTRNPVRVYRLFQFLEPLELIVFSECNFHEMGASKRPHTVDSQNVYTNLRFVYRIKLGT